MLARKACIIGASSGIGRDIVYLLQHEVEELTLCGRDEKVLHTIQKELSLDLVRYVVHNGRKEQFNEVIEEALDADLVIITAGIGCYGSFLDWPFKEHEEIVDLNLIFVMELIHAVAGAWKEGKKSGTILVVSSFLDAFPTPLMSAYGASKSAVSSFCESIDYELAPFSIRCLVSKPGQVRTAFRSRSLHVPYAKQHGFFVLESKAVAKEIVQQIQKKQSVRIIDWRYRALHMVLKWMPLGLIKKWFFRSIQTILQNKEL